MASVRRPVVLAAVALCGLRRNWLLGLLGSSLVWLASPDADACSCAPGSRLNWPAGNQTNVFLDTSVIISGYGTFAEAEQFLVPAPVDAGQGAPVAPDGGVGTVAPLPPIEQPEHPAGLHLVSPNGMVVELVLERTLPTVDCTSMYQFFHQESGELEVNTSYQIYEGDTFVATFTTGAERRNLDSEVAEAKAVKFETLGTSEQPSRITTAYVTNLPSTLAFVHYAGSEQEVTYPMYDGTAVATYDFGALECPVVEILGMDGAALDERTLCEPERCMQLPDTVIVSSCGGNHMFGVEYDEFIALPACGATADGGAASPSDSSVSSASSDRPSGGDSTSARDVSASAGDDSALTGSDASPLGNDTASTDDDASPPNSASNELPIDDEPNSGKVPLDESARRYKGGCSVSVGNAKTWAWLGLAIVGLAARRKHAGKSFSASRSQTRVQPHKLQPMQSWTREQTRGATTAWPAGDRHDASEACCGRLRFRVRRRTWVVRQTEQPTSR